MQQKGNELQEKPKEPFFPYDYMLNMDNLKYENDGCITLYSFQQTELVINFIIKKLPTKN